MDKDFDIVVMGSGAAGLTAALFAAQGGARVLVLEKTSLFGGTSAISGGQLWIPNNRFVAGEDSPALALRYLAQVTLGETRRELLESFVEAAPRMAAEVERLTGLSFAKVDRADYHSEWDGAHWGRSLEPMPFDTSRLAALAARVRRSPYRPPLTSAEIRQGGAADLATERRRAQVVTQGAALVCGLVQGCVDAGVDLRADCKVTRMERAAGGRVVIHFSTAGAEKTLTAKALVLASGGFEWNESFKRAFLACPDEGAASPPGNEGDGLRIGMAASAALDNMTQAWWSAAFRMPGELYEGRPLVRNIVRELALPGAILVNADGRRFVNEAASYNSVGKAFQAFDVQGNRYPNERAWLVFDQAFKERYTVATITPQQAAPAWFTSGASVTDLATQAGIDGHGLLDAVARFNTMARAGRDLDFGRGDARHDRYHGDATQPHANLGPLSQPPFYAVPIFLGNLGTKGGVKTDEHGRVLSLAGGHVPGLFACGNVAASWMGPGYPGAGGSLGPVMTAASLCGSAAARSVAGARLEKVQ